MKYRTIISLIIISSIFTSCFSERIELDLNQGSNVRLAIEAWITDLDEVQTVILSQSSDYFDDFKQTAVTDAEVLLNFDNQTIIMEHTSNGTYAAPSDWRAESGKEYTLTINHNSEEYTATSLMKDMPELEDARSEFYDTQNDTSYYYVLFSFQETDGEGDGYIGVDYKKGEEDWKLTSGEYTNDDFVDGLYFEDISVTNGDYFLGDTIILEMYSIGLEASNFLQDIESEVFRNGLFSPPPVNIRSNFSNGALGYFIASGAERAEVSLEVKAIASIKYRSPYVQRSHRLMFHPNSRY